MLSYSRRRHVIAARPGLSRFWSKHQHPIPRQKGLFPGEAGALDLSAAPGNSLPQLLVSSCVYFILDRLNFNLFYLFIVSTAGYGLGYKPTPWRFSAYLLLRAACAVW